jgi:hypothetical protein
MPNFYWGGLGEQIFLSSPVHQKLSFVKAPTRWLEFFPSK